MAAPSFCARGVRWGSGAGGDGHGRKQQQQPPPPKPRPKPRPKPSHATKQAPVGSPTNDTMPQASEDVLGALYGWDSIIDDVFELPPTDPEHDEDKALDAYEEVIGTASAPADATDAVLILAAQLLTKHFFKFPHVHMNVVDIMLLLASPERSQAVRIRTIRSLLQLVTPAAEGAISSACRDKIRDFIQKLMETETSGVIVRHMTQLSKAVKENAAQEAKENSAKNQKPDTSAKKKDSADDTTTANGASRGDGNDRDVAEDTTDRSRTSDNDRPNAKSAAHHSCPPAPYVFLGNVPKNASNSEVAEFLSAVDPSLTPSCVQIKQAPRQNSHYAFVSMASVKMAHRAIEYVSRVKLRGSWNLNANYARGPPCETLVFIEMSDTEEVVRSFSFHKCDKYVWDELCDILGRFGPMDVVDVGKIRFHDVEHAKLAIRKHHFTINGMDIVPVYDPEEQLANDATRSRRGSNSSKQSFALKSGRVVGDEDSRYSRRANESEYAAQRETEGVKRSRSPSRHEYERTDRPMKDPPRPRSRSPHLKAHRVEEREDVGRQRGILDDPPAPRERRRSRSSDRAGRLPLDDRLPIDRQPLPRAHDDVLRERKSSRERQFGNDNRAYNRDYPDRRSDTGRSDDGLARSEGRGREREYDRAPGRIGSESRGSVASRLDARGRDSPSLSRRGSFRSRSRSPLLERPVTAPRDSRAAYRAPEERTPLSNGSYRGSAPRSEPLEKGGRRPSGGEYDRRDDDRSIAEIAREQQERARAQQYDRPRRGRGDEDAYSVPRSDVYSTPPHDNRRGQDQRYGDSRGLHASQVKQGILDERRRDVEGDFRARAGQDHVREGFGRDDRNHDARGRNNRARDDPDNGVRDDRGRNDRFSDDRVRDDRIRDDRPRGDRAQDDRLRADRVRDDRVREDRVRGDRVRDDRDQVRGDRGHESRVREDRSFGREHAVVDDRLRGDRSRGGQFRDDRVLDDPVRTSRPRDSETPIRPPNDRLRDDRKYQSRGQDRYSDRGNAERAYQERGYQERGFNDRGHQGRGDADRSRQDRDIYAAGPGDRSRDISRYGGDDTRRPDDRHLRRMDRHGMDRGRASPSDALSRSHRSGGYDMDRDGQPHRQHRDHRPRDDQRNGGHRDHRTRDDQRNGGRDWNSDRRGHQHESRDRRQRPQELSASSMPLEDTKVETGTRLRSLTPSPVRRDDAKRSRDHITNDASSPRRGSVEKPRLDEAEERYVDKKRRLEEAPADDVDECMVDYEEDDE